MAANHCLPQIFACALRATSLNTNGSINAGAANMIVSNAIVKLTITPVYETGDEITGKNGCGTVALSYKAPDTLKRADVTLEMITRDPLLEALLTNGTLISSGNVRGFKFPAIGDGTEKAVSLEAWVKRINNGALDADYPYAHWALPYVKDLVPGPVSLEAGQSNPTYTGQAVENTLWYDGPGNDWLGTSDRCVMWQESASIPATACGYTTVAGS